MLPHQQPLQDVTIQLTNSLHPHNTSVQAVVDPQTPQELPPTLTARPPPVPEVPAENILSAITECTISLMDNASVDNHTTSITEVDSDDDVAQTPTSSDDDVVNHLSAEATYELYHQRLGHPSAPVLMNTQKRVLGIPKLKQPDDLHVCDSCARCKITKKPKGKPVVEEPSGPCEHIHADFGFMAAVETTPEPRTDNKRATTKPRGINKRSVDNKRPGKPPINKKPGRSSRQQRTPKHKPIRQQPTRAAKQTSQPSTSKPTATRTPYVTQRPGVPQQPEVKMKEFEVPPEDTDKATTIQKHVLLEGLHGYKAYLLITCRYSKYVWVFLTK